MSNAKHTPFCGAVARAPQIGVSYTTLSALPLNSLKNRFYDNIEYGLGARFRDYIFGEIDNLVNYAGTGEVHFGYYRALANRFHQNIYYKIDGDTVVVWRILDQRFNPRRIEFALTHPEGDI